LAGRRDVTPEVPSPPTDRVVEVVGLLLEAAGPLRISEIVDRLRINRATCSVILETLAMRGWVERLPDRSYQPGGGLIPIANAVRSRLPILQSAEPVMNRLFDELDVKGIALSLIDGNQWARVTRVGSPTGVDVGPMFRMPLIPPFGAVVVAFGTDREQRTWLDLVGDRAVRQHLQHLLETVRQQGVAIWRFDAYTQFISDAIFASHSAFVSKLLASPPDADSSRRLTGLLHELARLGYLASEIQSKRSFSVAYLEAPIFDADGRTCYELEVHVLREAVSKQELKDIVARIRIAADELTAACGGRAPHAL
jgi:DNA-binding IclR family transcriptional regulator